MLTSRHKTKQTKKARTEATETRRERQKEGRMKERMTKRNEMTGIEGEVRPAFADSQINNTTISRVCPTPSAYQQLAWGVFSSRKNTNYPMKLHSQNHFSHLTCGFTHPCHKEPMEHFECAGRGHDISRLRPVVKRKSSTKNMQNNELPPYLNTWEAETQSRWRHGKSEFKIHVRN